jgi:hypothetical protein
MKRKEAPVTCPFCEAKVPRPTQEPSTKIGSDTLAGFCPCGAVYVADETGKGGGQALMDGLTLLCEGDVDRALDLQFGVSYKMEKFGYRPRTHSLESRMPRKGGAYGLAKIWFFILCDKEHP